MSNTLPKDSLRIAGFEEESVVDGPGIRNVIFFQGCANHCEGCHNPETWDPQGGQVYSLLDIFKQMDAWRENTLVDGITLSGGDPLYFLEHEDLSLLESVRQVVEYAHYLYDGDVILYTGYSVERILKSHLFQTSYAFRDLLHCVRYVIAEPYIQSLRTVEKSFRGSTNQSIISLYPKTPGADDWAVMHVEDLWDKGEFDKADNQLRLVAPYKFTGDLAYGAK